MTTTAAESKMDTPAVEKQTVDVLSKEVTTPTAATDATAVTSTPAAVKDDAAEKPGTEEPAIEEEPLKKDTRKKLGAALVKLNHADASVNALITPMLITNANFGSWNLLTAGVRAAVGVKSGRYVYEVQVHGATATSRLHVGVSTLKSCLVYPDEHAIMIDQNGVSTVGGARKTHPKIQMRRDDVVSVLINRDSESKHKNTVSVYINGQRELTEEGTHICTIPIPETLQNEILFPHLIFKDITISTNFGPKALKPLPFPTRMLADAAKADVEVSRVESPVEPTLVVPFGLEESSREWVSTFCAENSDYIDLSRSTLREWANKSCDTRHTADKVFQNPREVCQMFGTMRVPRSYAAPLKMLTAAGRKKVLDSFPGFKKVCKVAFTSSDTSMIKDFDAVTFPTTEEGFDVVEYVRPQEECEAALNEWKDMCKKKARVEDLKVGTWFNEDKEKWTKLCAEIRKEKKYPQLTAEDWMLADLRHRIHSLLNAFKEDVKDETRPGFAMQNLGFYAKVYDAKPMSLSTFGCKNVEDMLELVGDVVVETSGLLTAKYGKDVDLVTFLELTEAARQEREHRVDAGDENAALSFSASTVKKDVAPKGLKKIADQQPKKAVSLTPNDKVGASKRKLNQLGASAQPRAPAQQRVVVTANSSKVPHAPKLIPVRIGQAHAQERAPKRSREESGKASDKGRKLRRLNW